ncbi:MAG: hypothetical protein ABI969_16335 [bacterium]
MTGWEATAQAGHESAAYPLYRDTLLALAAGDLGLNRLRLEVRSGVENTRDYYREGRSGRLDGNAYRCGRYETVNDNDDPRVINWNGFKFSELDRTVETLALPLRKAIAARGGRMVLNVTYVSFLRQCPQGRRYDHTDAAEYAEFVLATSMHLRDKYGLVPDLWEIILEPDNTDDWSSAAIGRAIVAASARLHENGFATRFVAPSNTAMEAALRYYDVIRTMPGVRGELAELSYHRYRINTNSVLREFGVRAKQDSIGTSMLEHIGSDVDDLFDDLTIANVSAWSQYALAHTSDKDRGGLYYIVDESDAKHPVVREGSRTPYLRQVFRAAQLGATRIGASSDLDAARPVAFRNPDGRIGVAIRTTRSARLTVSGLPAGRYAITFATAKRDRGALLDAVLTARGRVIAEIPAAGVLTMLAR